MSEFGRFGYFVQHGNAEEDEPEEDFQAVWFGQPNMVKFKDVFGVLECLFNLKAVVVNLHHFVPATTPVVGQDIPRFGSSAALRGTDNPQG